MPAEAFRAWRDLQQRGLAPNSSSRDPKNVLTNGDFENEPTNAGFDWRINPVDGVYATLDQRTFHSPSHALLLNFAEGRNLEYRQVYQYVKVSPNRSYRLEALVESEEVTSDSGVRLEVRDAYERSAIDKFSEQILGSIRTWRTFEIEFTTGQRTELVVVGLVRLPTMRLNNRLTGKIWVDDLRLIPAQE